MSLERIQQLLPHRYPFLLIDRVREFEPGRRIVAAKNVTINEPFFPGHFPARPVMPGVLILEALAQAAAVLAFESDATLGGEGRVVYLAGIDEARFKRPVVPGDILTLEVDIERIVRNIGRFRGRASVDGAIAAEATLLAALRV
ncbi:MAG: 3-hydroxyacyl-ACP dehydratase FabZ [Casimicrobiaceae bacterium]|nr:3-hydroxyacyl-ACP dehydratase FabZ [Casimicrobiaceae bacterium]MCX8098963.1 3-hydroxyacyl-ACP dehydratase FabZ [Casimicrobiaceae bacterium]